MKQLPILCAVLAAAPAASAAGRDAPPAVEARIVWRTSAEHAGKSSPRTADFNADGVDDVVVGTGFEERWGEVVALDGRTGGILWRRRVADEVLTTSPALDVDGDGIRDVLATGRRALRDVFALSGRDGRTLWRLGEANPQATFPQTNFSTLLVADDRDGDGARELLIVQSGGNDELRLAARLYRVRPRDGKLLATAVTPDGRECYSIPLFDRRSGSEPRLWLGTGGETLSGSLFRLSWPALETRWRVRAIGGGFIGSPVLADLDADGAEEILATAMNGAVYRIDADSGEIVWRWRERPWWTYVTPAPGSFNDAPGLDVVAGFNRGRWPRRDAAKLVWLDGATGRVISERTFEERSRWTASSPLVLDLDGDERDETLIVLSNPVPDAEAPDESHRLLLFGSGAARVVLLDLEFPGYSIATPVLADLDGNGKLDLVHATHYEVLRIELSVTGPAPDSPPVVRWGELRGPEGTGILSR
jgi:outer membrane protein assembly factor BamB